MAHLLGLDLGTSSAKAILFNAETGKILATATHEYPIDKPTPNRAEQNPETWWQAIVYVVRRVTALAETGHVTAISFSGQMHGTILLDKNNVPLHPAIIWADQRSGDASQTLAQTFGKAEYTAITGTLPAAGFLGATLLWLLNYEPKLLANTQSVILPKDYLRLKMTGQIATDVSDAAGTGIFDIHHNRWATPILNKVGLPPTILPPVLPSTAVAGHLIRQAAEQLGLQAGIPVVAGCADQPAQPLATG